MIDAIAGILLVLVGGLCVLAFPFVLWMLFGGAPRSTSRPRRSGTAGPSVPSEDREEAPSPYDEAEEEEGFK